MQRAGLGRGSRRTPYTVSTVSRDSRRSHIVTVGTFGAGDTETTNDQRLDRIARALADNGVRFTIRKGLLRFGLHYYNDETDVERVLRIVKRSA